MASQIDYAAALVIFLVSFIAVTSVVYSHSASVRQTIQETTMELYARSLLEVSEIEWFDADKISAVGIATDAYVFELTVAGDGIVNVYYGNLTYTADQNSFAIYPKGSQDSIPYDTTVNGIKFLASGSNEFIIWFDDDSSFPAEQRSEISGQTVASIVWPVEEKKIISYASMQKLMAEDYSLLKENYEYRISIMEGDEERYAFGSTSSEKAVAARKPVAFQRSNGDIGRGELVVRVWR